MHHALLLMVVLPILKVVLVERVIAHLQMVYIVHLSLQIAILILRCDIHIVGNLNGFSLLLYTRR